MTSVGNSLAAHQFKDTGKPSTTNPLFSGTELKQDPSIQYLHPSNVFKPFIINRTMESVQTYGRKVRDSCTFPISSNTISTFESQFFYNGQLLQQVITPAVAT